MTVIKHIAFTTKDSDKVAAFYVDALGMKEVGRGSDDGHISLSDGELNITILPCKSSDDADVGTSGADFSGLHHIGFVVDNVDDYVESIEKAGGKRLTSTPTGKGTTKVSGPDGVILDISETGWLGMRMPPPD